MLAATPVHAQPTTPKVTTAATSPAGIEARRKVLLTQMMADPSARTSLFGVCSNAEVGICEPTEI